MWGLLCYGGGMNIGELRNLAKSRERAATRKVNRVLNKGIDVRWTAFDPRQVVSNVESMNSRQLNSYIKKLDAFTARTTQFDAGYKGAPLPRALVRRYRAAEAKRNAKGTEHTAKLRDVYIEPTGMTVAQREDMITASNLSILRAGGNPQMRPYDPINRSIAGMVDASKLMELTKLAERQGRTDFIRKGLIKQRQNQTAFLEKDGAEDQAARLKKLTLRQFDILMNQTNYRELNDFRYLTADKSGSANLDRISDDASSEIDELISWAERL